MRIQAIATLTTAAAVSFFGFQDPDQSPGIQTEVPGANGSPTTFTWETGMVETGQVELYQNAGAPISEPDPFADAAEGRFPADLPPVPVDSSAEEEIFLADSNEEDILDLSLEPDLIDLASPLPATPVESVSTGIELAESGKEPDSSPLQESTDPLADVSSQLEKAIASIDSGATAGNEDTDPAPSFDVPADLAIDPVDPVDTILPDVDPSLAGEVLSSDGLDLANGPSPDLVLDTQDAPLVGPVDPRAAVTATPTDSVPSVATSVASQLVESVSEAVNAGGPDYADDQVESQAPTMGQEQDGGGFWLKGARLNEVYQYLARLGGMQYFHNTDLDAGNFVVTGHLGDGDPIAQMEELGLMYGVTVYTKGSTVYALTEGQIARLPTKPFQYHLKYLRPTDIEQIKTILQPVLTPGSGTVDYEQKTNTLIVIDNEQKIQDVKDILAEMDMAKDQIAIETRILRITSKTRNRIGVDWESVLGDGLTFEGMESLNTLFNLPDTDTVTEVVTRLTDTSGRTGFTTASVAALSGFSAGSESGLSVDSDILEGTAGLNVNGDPGQRNVSGQARESGLTEGFSDSNSTTQNITSTGSHLVLSPLALSATLRALNQGGLAQQESSPTLVTEDNEPGVISIIDRIPIIVTTVSETTAGQNISEEVRYRVDLDDPVNDPATTREIGITVAVTPTLLPDNTIRMALRPRSAQVVEFVSGQTGNLYPRVNESTVDTIARVPNGHSLLIGGFYEQNELDGTNKVPILGDIPGLGFFFKSTDKQKENTSLVFVVTPKKYSPVIIDQSDSMTRGLHERHVMPRDFQWPDRENPGFNHQRNMGWTLGNIFNKYPATPQSNPLHPNHPANEEMWLDGQNGPVGDSGQAQSVQPVAAGTERRGFFKKLFKKRQR